MSYQVIKYWCICDFSLCSIICNCYVLSSCFYLIRFYGRISSLTFDRLFVEMAKVLSRIQPIQKKTVSKKLMIFSFFKPANLCKVLFLQFLKFLSLLIPICFKVNFSIVVEKYMFSGKWAFTACYTSPKFIYNYVTSRFFLIQKRCHLEARRPLFPKIYDLQTCYLPTIMSQLVNF